MSGVGERGQSLAPDAGELREKRTGRVTVPGLRGSAEAGGSLAAAGDMVICLGAGDITKWAGALADGIACARREK